MDPKAYRKGWWAWALYDVGNSAFFLIIVATIFPIYYQESFVDLQAPDRAALSARDLETLRTRGGSRLAFTAGIAMAVVAILGPILGAAADRGAAKKRFLAGFAALGVASSGLLFFAGNNLLLVSVLYATGTIGVAGSIVFYDALLPAVARADDMDRVSAIGFAAGYLGSVLLLIFNVVTIKNPEWFGLSKGIATRLSFLGVAVWWALFTVPLLRRVPEPPAAGPREGGVLLSGFRQLGRTFRKLGTYRQLLLFLAAYWIYSDGIGTIIKMAAPFGNNLGIPEGDIFQAFILTQVVGVPCALLFAAVARRIGARAGILIGLGVYTLICASAVFVEKTWHFYALAIGVGLVQGGTQALSRSLFASMTPPSQSAEFFGFFSAMEKFAGILGPVLLGILWGGGDPRKGILAIAVFFLAGAALLSRVNVRKAQEVAQAEAAREGAPA